MKTLFMQAKHLRLLKIMIPGLLVKFHMSHWISGISPADDVNAIGQGWFAEFFFLDL
ncbi:TPA: hypothetical protein ACF8KN_001984 [Salmonella enterica]